MRDLTHAKVLKLTAYATLATALFRIPRVAMWSNRAYPIWYLEAIIFTGAFVLWGFVFAWHMENKFLRCLALGFLLGIQLSEQELDETKSALRELGLNDDATIE